MPALDPPHGPQPEFSGAAASLHAALILLAYGAFGLASVSSIMFLSQEHNLKFRSSAPCCRCSAHPATPETVTLRLVMAGFALLTLGLAIGDPSPAPQWPSALPRWWSGRRRALYLALLLSRTGNSS
ncbi:MAG: cytochrome c biogenesis protein CcsA [Verrucomicrobiota bacterium]